LTFTRVNGPANGSLTLNSDGSFSYTPNSNYHGPDSFTFTASDGTNTSTPATVSITVADNSVPVGQPLNLSTNEDTAVSSSVTATDSDNDPLTYLQSSGPSNGSLKFNNNGTFTYTPRVNYHGPDSFTFTASDGTNTSAATTVSIMVVDISVPVGRSLNLSTSENTATSSAVAATDSDSDLLTFARVSGPTNGSLMLNVDGSFSYTPRINYHGPDSFTFTASDGTNTSQPATVSITVVDTSVPVASPQSLSTNENTTVSGNVTATDSDADPLLYTAVSRPTNGSLTFNSNGSFRYTPRSNYHGPDSFTFTASDGTSTSTPATVTINVADSIFPMARNDAYQTPEGKPLSLAAAGGVLQNDTDSDNDPLQVQLVSDVRHGHLSLALDGSFTYTPAAEFTGVDSFTYQASDGTNTSAPATVSLTVNPIPDEASIVANAVDGTYGIGAAITLTVSFDQTVTVDTSKGTPTLALNSGGVATYTGGSGTTGLIFRYVVASGDSTAALDYLSKDSLKLNGATIRSIPSAAGVNDADLTLPAPGSVGSISHTQAIAIDTHVPSITGVTTTSPNGGYGTGKVITLMITFDKIVAVNTTAGVPMLRLNSGGGAIYTSGSGSKTLQFGYTVLAGEFSPRLDYASTSALMLNGGTIRQAGLAGGANDANLTLPAPGSKGSISLGHALLIDGKFPVVKSLQQSNFNARTLTLTYQLVFSKEVTGVKASDFLIQTTGNVKGAHLLQITGKGTTYTITVLVGAGSGTLKLILKDKDDIHDLVGNPLGGLGIGNGDFSDHVPFQVKPRYDLRR
jgi:VCBS repeat-containing protein